MKRRLAVRHRSRAGRSRVYAALKTVLLPLAVVLASGCAMPRYTVGLHQVLADEIGRDRKDLPDYRCTRGAHRGNSLAFVENTLGTIIAYEFAYRPRFSLVERNRREHPFPFELRTVGVGKQRAGGIGDKHQRVVGYA